RLSTPPHPSPLPEPNDLSPVPSRKRFQGHREPLHGPNRGNVPRSLRVLNARPEVPLSGTERGTGGEDRNGEGDPKGLPTVAGGEGRNGEGDPKGLPMVAGVRTGTERARAPPAPVGQCLIACLLDRLRRRV